MNYKIISNYPALHNFVDNVLPTLTPSETYYVSLFARKKYWHVIKADKGQLKRFTSPKERIIEKIEQFQCEEGAYVFEGQAIPSEALAIYITPNPRCNIKATRLALVKCAELIANGNVGYNIHQEVMSCVQRAKSRSVYLDFDFDTSECPDLSNILNRDSYRVIKTRGGFHILVQPDLVAKQYKQNFVQSIRKLGPDVTGDCLLPIPGTLQGGVEVQLIEP